MSKSEEMASPKKSKSGKNKAEKDDGKKAVSEIAIIYEDERLQVNLSSKEFSFQTVDAWIRSRFGLKATDQLRYMNKLGAEHIPGQEDVAMENPIYVKKIKKEPSATSSDGSLWFSYTFCIITTVTFLLALYSKVYAPHLFPIRKWCDNVDAFMIALGVFPKKGIALEAFMAFVCWSSTYLFIRRLWNPETMRATVEKYSADSFFGGLAAAGSIILKNVLTSVLSEK